MTNDQWGNGLKLIADELKAYLEIEFKWFERGGLQFQVQFINKEYITQQELQQERTNPTLYSKVLNIIADTSRSRKEISIALKQRSRLLISMFDNESVFRSMVCKIFFGLPFFI